MPPEGEDGPLSVPAAPPRQGLSRTDVPVDAFAASEITSTCVERAAVLAYTPLARDLGGSMRRIAWLLLVGAVLFGASRARAAAGGDAPEARHLLVFQLTAGLIGGTLAVGYGAALAPKFGVRGVGAFGLAPLPFAVGAGLAVWLAGRWGGVSARPWGPLLGAGLPAVAGALAALASGSRDDRMILVSLVGIPLASLVGALVGFELTRDDGGGGGDAMVRRALADERSL